MLQTIFSFIPIVFLIFLMTKKKAMPSYQALPLIAFLTYVLMLFLFRFDATLIHANVIAGLLTAWTPILIIWGAIFLFRTMEAGGAMKILNGWLNTITTNQVAQLMIVGWAFAFLIEGASGFGTPAALAAPVLVGLGFKPLNVAIMVLIMNTVPVSFGAVGTPTWFGFSGIDLTQQEIQTIGIKTAFIQLACSLIIPILALRFVVTWKEIKANIVFIFLSVISTMIPYVAVAFFSYEFPSLVGGSIGLIASVFIASKGWGLERSNEEVTQSKHSYKEVIKAGFPLWGTLVLLVITRLPQLGIKSLLNATDSWVNWSLGSLGDFSISTSLVLSLKNILMTTVGWSHKLLYVPSLIPFGLIALLTAWLCSMNQKDVGKVFSDSINQVRMPAIALFGALVFVKLMMMGEELSAVSRIGLALANFGGGWYYLSAVLGAVGSFFSGSNTISNLTFGPIQNAVALNLNLNQTTVLALQSVGGAMGNMVCINNIVAVCSVLALKDKEGYILVRTVRVLIPYALVAALIAVIFFR